MTKNQTTLIWGAVLGFILMYLYKRYSARKGV